MFPALPDKKYAVILADPPWDYHGQTQHNGKGGKPTGSAAAHYSTVRLKDLKQLDVSSICEPDCLLFMWSSSPHLEQALELMHAWKFSWATVGFVWYKEKTNPGFYTLSECELCLIGKRGKIPQPRGARNVRQFLSKKRTEHSKKPNEIRDRIHTMFPAQNKIELFATEHVENWDAWGRGV